jgi:hypothetical protein
MFSLFFCSVHWLLPVGIYRKEDGKWTVVGKSEVETPEEPGRNWFRLSKPIPVKRGDVIGLYFPKTGSVAYTSDPEGKMRYTPIGGKVQTGSSPPSKFPFCGRACLAMRLALGSRLGGYTPSRSVDGSLMMTMTMKMMMMVCSLHQTLFNTDKHKG